MPPDQLLKALQWEIVEVEPKGTYLLHKLLDLRPERVFFAFRRCGRREMYVEFLLGRVMDVGQEVRKVLRGLEVDFAVVGIHCLLCTSGVAGEVVVWRMRIQ